MKIGEEWKSTTNFLDFDQNYSAYGEELMYPPYDSKRGEETYYLYEELDANEITSQQKLYVQQYIDRFESAILGKTLIPFIQNILTLIVLLGPFLIK